MYRWIETTQSGRRASPVTPRQQPAPLLVRPASWPPPLQPVPPEQAPPPPAGAFALLLQLVDVSAGQQAGLLQVLLLPSLLQAPLQSLSGTKAPLCPNVRVTPDSCRWCRVQDAGMSR